VKNSCGSSTKSFFSLCLYPSFRAFTPTIEHLVSLLQFSFAKNPDTTQSCQNHSQSLKLRRITRRAIFTSSSTKMSTTLPSSRMSTQVSLPCLYPYNVDWTDSSSRRQEKYTSLNPQIRLFVQLTPDPVLQRVAGKDASKQFWKYHNEGILKKFKGQLQVGSLDTKKTAAPPTPPATPPPKEKKVKATPAPAPTAANAKESEALDPYGSIIPFADPAWYQSVCASPSVIHRQRDLAYMLSSITHHISTSLMPPFVTKSGNGSTVKLSRTLPSGMRPEKCQTLSTSRWVKEGTLPVC